MRTTTQQNVVGTMVQLLGGDTQKSTKELKIKVHGSRWNRESLTNVAHDLVVVI